MERSRAFRDFEASIADLNFLSLSLSYINEHENEFMDYLQRVKNLKKNQVVEEFIRMSGYISSTQNIRLRSSVEEYVKSKGYNNKILEQWIQKTPEYKIEYFPNSEKIHVLELNYLLRNYDAHSGKKDKFLKSEMTPSEIFSQEVDAINTPGQDIFFFTKDLSQDEIENELKNLMSLNNELTVMLYGEYLKIKILECITKIDESLNINEK